jgi:hypothetical protein
MRHLEEILRDAMHGEPFLHDGCWCVSVDAALAGTTMALEEQRAEIAAQDADKLMQEFYLSDSFDPYAKRRADVVTAAIKFALRSENSTPTDTNTAKSTQVSDRAFIRDNFIVYGRKGIDDVAIKSVELFRLERMNDNEFWLRLYRPGEKDVVFHVHGVDVVVLHEFDVEDGVEMDIPVEER